MNFEDLLDSVWELLPENLVNNESFNEIKHQILNVFSTLSESDRNDFSFRVREDILEYLDIEEFDKINVIDNGFSELFGIEFGNEKLFFMVKLNDDKIEVTFMTSKKGKHYKDIVITLNIDDEETLWDILSVVKDDNEYYYDYKREYFSISHDNKLIVPSDVEEKKDKDFSEFFGIDINCVRDIRLNFAKNRDYINNSLAVKDMKFFDDKYSENFIVFDGPVSMNELNTLLIGSELNKVYGESKSRLDMISANILNNIGYDGTMVMSHNLVMNIQAYVYLDYDNLNTNGYIIKKNDEKYTLFNINISNYGVMVIPSSVTYENLISLYNSSGNSEHTNELDEFFGIVKVKKLN